MAKTELKITEKQIETSDGFKEIRFFCETNDGFDGTAQGFGFKSKQKLYKAYWFHKNKGKLKEREVELKKFLKDNPDARKIIKDYLDPQECLYRWKDGEDESFDDMVEGVENPETKTKLMSAKHLWKTMLNAKFEF